MQAVREGRLKITDQFAKLYFAFNSRASTMTQLLSRRWRQLERLNALGLSICLSVRPSVRLFFCR